MLKQLTLLPMVALCSGIPAQEALNASGGDANGSTGVIHFSIGQVFYLSEEGTDNYQIQGVQQPYKITISTGFELKKIALKIAAFPNPVSDNLQLIISDFNKEMKYEVSLHNTNGKLLFKQTLLSRETVLNMSTYSKGVYFLKVTNENKTLKSFKILKL